MKRNRLPIVFICFALLMLSLAFATALTGISVREWFFGQKIPLTERTEKQGEAAPAAEPQVRISEVMASNKATLADSDGDFGDWLELCNEGTQPVSLEGWQLRCGGDWWRLPSAMLESGERLLIFCDRKDSVINGELHSSFAISADGETIRLFGPDGEKMDSFPVTQMSEDCSACRNADGTVSVSEWPTPGYENSEAGYLAFQYRRAAEIKGLVISEVMVNNDRYAPLNSVYYDWIELYNPTDQILNLGDFFLSDQERNRQKSTLPDRKMAPGEYVLLYCDSMLSGNQAVSLNLDAIKEELYLSDKNGTLCDYMLLRDVPLGCSYGRNGENGFVFLEIPTPGQENIGGAHFTGEAPTLLGRDGVFDGEEEVIVTLAGKGTIRFTLDGSEPDASSMKYPGPMRVVSTCVLRAACFQEDHCRSDVLSLSYFINEGHRLPVVSLVCDSDQMFAEPGGVYNSPNKNLEIPGTVMFYGDEGSFRIDCGVKLHGATSRVVQQKKSLKLCFRDRYEGALRYDLFENGVSTFSSLLLRSGQEGKNSSYMRDALMHDAVAACFPALSVQDHRYTALYINGVYWGIYNLREAHSEEHYANHYGLDVRTVTHWHEKWNNDTMMEELYQFALSHDLSKEENYDYVAKHIDTDSVIAWLVVQDYSGNIDFNSPNMRFYWTEEDQKLHYALVDLDLGLFTEGNLTSLTYRGYYAYCKLAGALMKNAEFRKEFCIQLNKALTGELSDEAMLERIDRFADEIRPEIGKEKERWGGKTADWERLVDDIRGFITKNNGHASNMVKLMVTNGGLHTDEAREYLPTLMK